ncbi:MAG TPA: YbaB/EbfC family nucleoid-associated protein [Planctomycetota bacterium]|nr:YbaB/EbfC family nucleoid-associated protein [Planctomycetota bacterium]
MSTGNLGDMLRQVTRVRKDIDRVQEDLKNRYVQAGAGGGGSGGDLVEVTLSGKQQLVKIALNERLFAPGPDGKVDIALIEDLIVAAFAKGMEKSRALMKEEVEKATGDAGVGNMLSGLLSGMT